ncbi:helix-turn-helix domain-containing protein [Chryseobacterium sp. RG1]|uniref:Helix-turn-helix domain-containing protein n=1 Tax=Chryseobacterium tagetis TaxID=2801334 RepID=A0ABS8A4I7_9FLAO|nr:helix-turn-helix domain-containing protein [Chryseobacterium tagetis]MCA6067815.1 helix-turn-helix domain-containing protein [Chryseobacterium tagetis]
MSNQVRILREKQHMTQTELAEKSGLSLRTIQRIEAGSIPKGFTLKALAQALHTEPEKIVPSVEEKSKNDRAKLINLSALCGLIIPFGGVIVPLILTYKTKDPVTKEIGKDIISIQILLASILSVFMILSPFIQHFSGVRFPLFLVPLIILLGVKLFIIIRNGISLNQNNNLHIKLKTNFL